MGIKQKTGIDSVILGANLLKEIDGLRRVAAGFMIVCGVILLNIA
jgi:hypothetical protein